MDEQGDGATTTGVPAGLPVLDMGRHRRPEDGACVMEYVSVLAGRPWSDSPRCTDRALGELARRVNDDVRESARPALAEIAPRLVGAVGPEAATDVVVAALVRVGLESAPDDVVLTRIRRRVEARIERAAGRPGPSRLRRLLVGHRVTSAYLQVARAVAGRPRAERDAVRVRALVAATEDVRRHLGVRAALVRSPGGSVVRSG